MDLNFDPFDKENTVYLVVNQSVVTLYLNRPQKKNALNLKTWQHLIDCLDYIEQQTILKVAVVTSSSAGVFCAGADISEFQTIALDAKLREKQRLLIREAQRRLARLTIPTIAMISGPCVGAGCGLSIHCDFRIATPNARFGITPAKLGLIYPLNDTKQLVDLVGPSQAKRILFSAQLFSADQALSMGLIDDIYQVDTIEAHVYGFAERIAHQSCYSIKGMKENIQHILDGQVDDDEKSAKMFTDAYDHQDYHEGVKAFLEKRIPKF